MDLNINVLLGKVISLILVAPDRSEVMFILNNGEHYRMFHSQDCCESVSLDDISGELADLVNSPITKAEEVTSNEPLVGREPQQGESFTWTFYHLATVKGYVTLRWYGESNGYYSETVSFQKAA
jgi:hypothetical protein